MFCGKVVSPAITCDFVFLPSGRILSAGPPWGFMVHDKDVGTAHSTFFEAKYSCQARKIFLQNALQNEESGATAYIRT